jgi:broad specificity phosphatase PhoE
MGLLLLVRHGQASFGAADYDVLSPTGASQARHLGVHLRGLGIDPSLVLHGGMRRQRETAAEMVDELGPGVPLETDPRWDEFDHLSVISAYADLPGSDLSEDERERHRRGTLERREFQQLFEKATGRWVSGAHDGEYAEAYPDFVARVRDALAHAARQAGRGRTVVVVTSGGAIAAACAMLVDVAEEPRQLAVSWQRLNAVAVNASITRVVVGSTGARMLTFNEHAWLPPKLVTYR